MLFRYFFVLLSAYIGIGFFFGSSLRGFVCGPLLVLSRRFPRNTRGEYRPPTTIGSCLGGKGSVALLGHEHKVVQTPVRTVSHVCYGWAGITCASCSYLTFCQPLRLRRRCSRQNSGKALCLGCSDGACVHESLRRWSCEGAGECATQFGYTLESFRLLYRASKYRSTTNLHQQ